MAFNSSDITGFNRFGALGDFPSPWRTMAAASMPTANADALKQCEYCWNADGTYRTARERIGAYFLTDVEVTSPDDDKPLGDDEKSKWVSMLENTLLARETAAQADIDVGCYGNAFITLVVPFKRFLISSHDKTMYEFERTAQTAAFDLKYDAGANEFTAICPKKKARCKFTIKDFPDDVERKLKTKTWSPHEIEIVWDPWSNDCAYVWKIPEDYRREIRGGNMHQLARCPRQILEAICENKWFRFAPNAMLHIKENSVSGLRMKGWGLSRVLLNYRDIFHVQVLRCYNEAIAMDYVMPLRLLTPETAAGSPSDTPSLINLGDARAQINGMLRKRRQDPTSWHTLPFPIKYHMVGG